MKRGGGLKFLLRGVPFLAIVSGSVIALIQFQSVRYDFRRIQQSVVEGEKLVSLFMLYSFIIVRQYFPVFCCTEAESKNEKFYVREK